MHNSQQRSVCNRQRRHTLPSAQLPASTKITCRRIENECRSVLRPGSVTERRVSVIGFKIVARSPKPNALRSAREAIVRLGDCRLGSRTDVGVTERRSASRCSARDCRSVLRTECVTERASHSESRTTMALRTLSGGRFGRLIFLVWRLLRKCRFYDDQIIFFSRLRLFF